MESKKGTVVSGIDPVLAEIQQRLQAHPKEWLKALQQNPGRPRQSGAENSSHVCADGRPHGGRIVGASDGGCRLRRGRQKKVAPADPKRKVRGGEPRPLRVRLLGGLLIYVMTIYCSPARRTGQRRGREGSGLYPELGVLGIQEGKSPALVREVGRLTALLPSYEIGAARVGGAWAEFEHQRSAWHRPIRGAGGVDLSSSRVGTLSGRQVACRGWAWQTLWRHDRRRPHEDSHAETPAKRPRENQDAETAITGRTGVNRSKSSCSRWTSKAA